MESEFIDQIIEAIRQNILNSIDWEIVQTEVDKDEMFDVLLTVKNNNGKLLKIGIYFKSKIIMSQLSLTIPKLQKNGTVDIVSVATLEFTKPEMNKLKDQGVSFFDLAGNYLFKPIHRKTSNVYLFEFGHTLPKNYRRPKSYKFTPSSGKIIMALLNAYQFKVGTMRVLSEITGLSLGGLHPICTVLKENEFISYSKSDAITVIEPEKLLDEWSVYYLSRIAPKIKQQGYLLQKRNNKNDDRIDISWKDAINTLSNNTNSSICLTGTKAANKWSDYYSLNMGEVLVEDINSITLILKQEFILTPVNRTPGLMLIEPFDNSAFYNIDFNNEIPLANPVQIYLDLLSSVDSRANELAKYLRKNALGY